MQTTSTTGTNNARCGARAFTLIELVLVMALLIMAISLIYPTLKRFFGTRDADSEVKKIVALMHYGQSRAVSEGVPMMLWVDARNGSYGLEQEPGYSDKDPKAVENHLPGGLRIGIAQSTAKPPVANSQTGRIMSGQATQAKNRLPAIYFMPDGVVAAGRSVSGISIQNSNDAPVWIVPSSSELKYEVQSQNPANGRR